ncbi:MAG: hypothetical protein HYS78_02240 [Parcubacteria group bacterium]|nr:hypothetical protein [Parcubacteria group bacterium]
MQPQSEDEPLSPSHPPAEESELELESLQPLQQPESLLLSEGLPQEEEASALASLIGLKLMTFLILKLLKNIFPTPNKAKTSRNKRL